MNRRRRPANGGIDPLERLELFEQSLHLTDRQMVFYHLYLIISYKQKKERINE